MHAISRNRFSSKMKLMSVALFIIILYCFIMNRGIVFKHWLDQHETIASSVYMSSMERSIIVALLNKSHLMLEYGSGYSTLYFSHYVKAYYSIEHDREWYKKVHQMIQNSPRTYPRIKKYVLASVTAGHRGWEGGIVEGTAEQFEDYVKAVRTLNVPKFDRVLIDGRARTACMQEIHPYLHNDSLVFLHDFSNRPYAKNISRKHYELILQTFEGQTIAVYKPLF